MTRRIAAVIAAALMVIGLAPVANAAPAEENPLCIINPWC